MTDYATRARAYAERVTAGEETAGKLERQACARFLSDLARENSDGFPYVFDAGRGARACRFLELLPHIKGEWAQPSYADGKVSWTKLRLEDWQVFIVMNLFGWLKAGTALRRFTRAYLDVARKNAKSTLAAGLLLFMTTADAEPGAHTYSAATTGEQAREVFDVARNMALREPEFLRRFGVTVGKHDITIPESASSARPLNAEGSTLDGLNVHFAVIDELHAHKTRAVYDVIDTATGARAQPLLLMITTAGFDTAGVCYEQRTYTCKVLEGSHVDDSWFGVIYTLDEGDLWHDPAVWRKANPNLGVSVKVDDLQAAVRKAQATPSALNNVLTKRMNLWVGAAQAWIPGDEWQACAKRGLRIDDYAGERCWIGLDLAEKRDFAAKARVFERDGDFALFMRLYLNAAAIAESGNSQLEGWVRTGDVVDNPGNVTDFDIIAAELRADCQKFDVQEIAFDPALSRYFATKLVEEGLPMVEIRQAPMFYTQPIIQMENLVLERRLQHDGNAAMAWMVGNVVIIESRITGLKHPSKEGDDKKIDGPIAALMALGRAMLRDASTLSVYEQLARAAPKQPDASSEHVDSREAEPAVPAARAPFEPNRFDHQALQYVVNTAGQAGIAEFEDDFAPIGARLWERLSAAGLVTVDERGAVCLTAAGVAVLADETEEIEA